MIWTLLVTILIETIVVFLYGVINRKPVGLLLVTSGLVNLLTQTILWFWLNFFHRFYIPALLIAEFLIWLVESIWMRKFSNGRLNHHSAAVLSLYMNTASFGIGLFLPI